MDLMNQLEKYILTELYDDESKNSISKDDDLISQGIIDSLGIMKLTDHLQKTYGITVLDDDIIPENFQTLDNLNKFVQMKLENK